MISIAVRDPEQLSEGLALLEELATEDERVKEAAAKIKGAISTVPNYLTTSEAAQALGVRSVNTVKYWVKTGYVHGIKRGSRTLIPASEIDRIREQDRVRLLRVSEQRQEESRLPGDDAPLTGDELALLKEARSGKNPGD